MSQSQQDIIILQQYKASIDNADISPHDHRLLHFMMHTGMRKNDVADMRVGHIEFHHDGTSTNHYPPLKKIYKQRKPLSIPQSKSATAILREQMDATGYNEPDDLIFPAEVVRSGLAKNTPQDPRRIIMMHKRLRDKIPSAPDINLYELHQIFVRIAQTLKVDNEAVRHLSNFGPSDEFIRGHSPKKHFENLRAGVETISTFYDGLSAPALVAVST